MSPGYAMVLGLSPTGLYVIRELGRAGVDVYGAEGKRLCASYSRYLQRQLVLEPGPEALEALVEFASSRGAPGVLIPTSDAWIEWLCANAVELAAHWKFAPAYGDGLAAKLLDKASFHALCLAEGLPVPGCWIGVAEELRQYGAAARYPCLLKPSLIHLVKGSMGGRKLFVLHSEQELNSRLDQLPPEPVDWILQEMIPGPESNITLYAGYFDTNSLARQQFTCRKLRQYPPGFGSASLVRSEQLEETRQLSSEFLSGLGYRGIAGAEFKYDERDQCLKIIEINPRPTLWFSLSHHAGKRIALAACSDLAGANTVPDKEQLDGICWRYLLKDYYSALFYRLRRGRDVLPEPVVGGALHAPKMVGPLLERDDKLPLWGEFRNYLAKLGGRFAS